MHERFPEYSQVLINQYVQFIIQEMADAIVMDNRIEIRGFGVFTLRHRVPRPGRDPRTGEALMWPEAFLPHFKPSKTLIEQLNSVKAGSSSTS